MFLFGTWDPWRCSKLSGHVSTARPRPRWSPGTRVATMPSLESWKRGLVPQFCAKTESSSKHLRVENRYLGILPAVASASPCHFRFFEQSVHEKHATPGTSRNTAWQHQHWSHIIESIFLTWSFRSFMKFLQSVLYFLLLLQAASGLVLLWKDFWWSSSL